jgi:hypothetical protein
MHCLMYYKKCRSAIRKATTTTKKQTTDYVHAYLE